MFSEFAKYHLVWMVRVPLDENHRSRASQPWFTFPAVWTLSEDLTSQSLNFLLCETEITALPNGRVSRRIKLNNASSALTTMPGN